MRILSAILLCTFLSACVSTGSESIQGTNGWNTVGANIWSTDKGILSADPASGKSYLVSPNRYKNFIVELEFWPDDKVNSGVFIHCSTHIYIGSKNCYEANIADNHKKPEYRTGSIVLHAAPDSQVNSIGKWNKLVFTSDNGMVVLEINGVKTAQASATKHPEGYISLQRFKDGVIKFRNIRITPL